MKNIAVKTNTVCKGFGSGETRTEVLKDVNFEARMGELLMLVGPSGCGKTTLLSVIAGTLGVDRGEVEVFDSPLHSMNKQAVTQFRAANIGSRDKPPPSRKRRRPKCSRRSGSANGCIIGQTCCRAASSSASQLHER